MQYLIVLVFWITFFAFNNGGYFIGSPLYTHFTYMFCHAGIIHLTLNSLSFIAMFRFLSIYIKPLLLFSIILFIGFSASFFAECTLPTVGASSMVYAMIGLFTGGILLGKYKIKNLEVFFIVLTLSLGISYFKQSSNFTLHIVSLLFGLLLTLFNTILRHEHKRPTTT